MSRKSKYHALALICVELTRLQSPLSNFHISLAGVLVLLNDNVGAKTLVHNHIFRAHI